MDELQWIREGNTEPAVTRPERGATKWAVAAAALLTGALVASGVWWSFVPSPSPPIVMRFSIDLPEIYSMSFDPRITQLARAPDGSRIVYVTQEGLHIREMNESSPRLLVGAELGLVSSPAISPDGKWVVFWHD